MGILAPLSLPDKVEQLEIKPYATNPPIKATTIISATILDLLI
jgi:hypothetical protein